MELLVDCADRDEAIPLLARSFVQKNPLEVMAGSTVGASHPQRRKQHHVPSDGNPSCTKVAIPKNKELKKRKSVFSYKITAYQLALAKSLSLFRHYKKVKTHQQCMSLTEKTEFPFFVFPYFGVVPTKVII